LRSRRISVWYLVFESMTRVSIVVKTGRNRPEAGWYWLSANTCCIRHSTWPDTMQTLIKSHPRLIQSDIRLFSDRRGSSGASPPSIILFLGICPCPCCPVVQASFRGPCKFCFKLPSMYINFSTFAETGLAP